MVPLLNLIFLFSGIIAAAPTASAQNYQPDHRFVGMLGDGTRIQAESLKDWHDQNSKPQFAGHAIFDENRPVRWITDQSVPLAETPASYVEFFGGDRLPCRIIDYQRPEPNAYEQLGAYLIVEPLVEVDFPGRPTTPFLRIRPNWLKRVVFGKRSGVPAAWTPGTVFLHDGSRIAFRAARWSTGGLAVLTESGVRTLLYSQVAELHLPRRDVWDVLFEQLAVLTPDLDGRVIQAETSDGLRITASTQRMRPAHAGDHSKTENWYPLLHPAWSLDPITVPFKHVRTWRFFPPEQPPMWMFEPDASRQKPVFSSGWDWQRNTSVQSSIQRNNRQLAGWGFGVHAPTTLAFPLHPVIREVRARAGLDQVAGNGGCARAVMALESQENKQFFRSDVLTGHEQSADSGWKKVRAEEGEQDRLLLIADPVVDDRPDGADPFDIRDCLDWLEPEWKLDRQAVQREVRRRLTDQLPPLDDWTVTSSLPLTPAASNDTPNANGSAAGSAAATDTDDVPPVRLVNVWDETVSSDERVRLLIQPSEPFAVFSRSMSIDADHRWLAISLTRPPGDSVPSLIQVRIDGRAMLETPTPHRENRGAGNPVLVPVDEFQGRDVRVDVIVIPESEESLIDWRGVALRNRRPGITPLFDEDGELIEHLTDGEGRLTLSTEDVQHGETSLKLTGGDRFNAMIPGFDFEIREHPQPGQYRYVRFAWKKQDGNRVGLQVAHDGQLGIPENEFGRLKPRAFRPRAAAAHRKRRRNPRRPISEPARGARYGYQYDAGNGKPDESVLRLDRRTPDEWKQYQRDLWGEFGAFTLTGLGFRSFEQGTAGFDQIYLARTGADFRWIDELAGLTTPLHSDDPNITATTDLPERYGLVLSEIAPQFATSTCGGAMQLLKEHAGREKVLRTTPPSKNAPCILRAPLTVRKGKTTTLHLSVSHLPQKPWQLVVKAAGKDLLRTPVDEKNTKETWLEKTIDLTPFAGKRILLQVHHEPAGGNQNPAFWHRLEITEK